jgi:hypothetical protein
MAAGEIEMFLEQQARTSEAMRREPITLPRAPDGAKLRPMIGAVIYTRVSTRFRTRRKKWWPRFSPVRTH